MNSAQEQNLTTTVPPPAQFWAYYGLMTRNDTLIQLAYDQIRLYRQSLQDPQTELWRHIYVPGGGSDSDPGLWATGEFAEAGLSCQIREAKG